MTTTRMQGGFGWSAILTISAAHFCLFADRALPSAFAPALRTAFHLTDAQIGALVGAAMILPYAVATLLAGHWLGNIAPSKIMVVSIVAWTAAALAGALASSFAMLVVSRIAFGIAQAAFAPAALALLSASVSPPAPLATSAFTTGSSSGRSGGLLIGGLLLMLIGNAGFIGIAPWRLASLALIAPNLIIAALLLRLGKHSQATLVPDLGLGGAIARVRAGPGTFAAHFAAAAGVLMIVQAGGAWAPSILNRNFAIDTASSAIWIGLVVLVGAPLGHLTGGYLASRADFLCRGPGMLMAGGSIITMLAAGALAYAPCLPIAIVALFLFVAASGTAAATALIGLQPILPDANRLAGNALYLATTTAIGYTAGPLLTGIVSDRIDVAGGGLANALFLFTALAAALVFGASALGASSWRRLALAGAA